MLKMSEEEKMVERIGDCIISVTFSLNIEQENTVDDRIVHRAQTALNFLESLL